MEIKSSYEMDYDSIANKLYGMVSKMGNNYGLFSGKLGSAFAYYKLWQITGSLIYKNEGDSLIQEVGQNISEVSQIDFYNGIYGIGWGIIAMIQNEYIELDYESFLIDFDDFIYKCVAFKKSNSLSLNNGSLGKAMYFYHRLLIQNPVKFPYRFISHKECLVLLTEEIITFVSNYISKTLSEYYLDIAQSMILLYDISRLKINLKMIDKLFIDVIEFIEESVITSSCSLQSDKIFLIYAYAYITQKANSPKMISIIKKWLNLYSLDYNELKSIVYHKQISEIITKYSDTKSINDIIISIKEHPNVNVSWYRALLL